MIDVAYTKSTSLYTYEYVKVITGVIVPSDWFGPENRARVKKILPAVVAAGVAAAVM
jgi:hypothetical protein